MGVAAAMFEEMGWRWLPSYRADPRAAALYRRHYSAEKNARAGKVVRNFMGPGETLVLLTADCNALFAWQRNVGAPRLDGQEGVCCTVFRNEGTLLSSDLIREAQEIAWQRWPGLRLFTYVDAAKTARRRSKHAQPGHCFIKAGWTLLPKRSKESGLYLLEILPPAPARSASAIAPAQESNTRGGHSDATAGESPALTWQAGRGAGARDAHPQPLDLELSEGHGWPSNADWHRDRRPAPRPSTNETPTRG